MRNKKQSSSTWKRIAVYALCFVIIILFFTYDPFSVEYDKNLPVIVKETQKAAVAAIEPVKIERPALDKDLYDKKMEALANNAVLGTSTASSTLSASSTPVISKPRLWPAKAAYPIAGAILPFNRIVAYYGNFYSKQMGVLGEYAPDDMLAKLMSEVERWKLADPETPVIPAIHYIVTTAQGSAGADGKYRLRMPSSEIEKAMKLAEQVKGLTFLDIQNGLSTVQAEVPVLKEYLKLPTVHLGIDPEFSMKTGNKPGTVIGTMDATDVNWVINYLASIVKENDLPPKILIIHRFTDNMVTNASLIQTVPEVQVVMDMDGWGPPSQKKQTYLDVIYDEPVQFTGLKLFYKNDLRAPSTAMLSMQEILRLKPKPIYIQYQ